MSQLDRTVIAGSHRELPPHAPAGAVDPDERATITLYLRSKVRLAEGGPRMTREELAAGHGADGADVDAVRTFAAEYGLEVTDVDLPRRAVQVTGRWADLARAFGTELSRYQDPAGGTYVGRSGTISVPAPLAAAVTGVFGLDRRPQAAPHFRRPAKGRGTPVSHTPPELAAAYEFPAGVDGSGQCIGVLELGGGYRNEDLNAYFTSLGLPVPPVTAVAVDGGANTPGTPSGPDTEVMLDIEVAGSVAPGASIAVYFAPNTDQGFIDAVTTAVHDTTNKPSVLSISWGGPENTWTTQAMTQMEDAFAAAAAVGVTITVAAGDSGSTDGVTDGAQHVDFPASAPHALGCGGTSLTIAGGQVSSEVVWDDLATGDGATGGGISSVFPVPSYQTSAGVPPSANSGAGTGRGVPDVAGDADPLTGYTIRVDGTTESNIGGTSAVAPLWAGLIACLNQAAGRDLGFVNPQLYGVGLPPDAAGGPFADITSGNNGAYRAGRGWDPCSGLGSPRGTALLAALQRQAATTP